MPEAARCESARTCVAFAGLNPEPRESGKMHYSRLSRMGSARIRSRLWMVPMASGCPSAGTLRWPRSSNVSESGESRQARGDGRNEQARTHRLRGAQKRASRLARRAAWDMRGREAHFSPPHDLTFKTASEESALGGRRRISPFGNGATVSDGETLRRGSGQVLRPSATGRAQNDKYSYLPSF